MKELFTTLMVVFLITLSHADCIGYTDEFDIRVLDAKLRPVEGAEVQATYDRGASFGPQYFTTDILETDGEGIVHMAIRNQGTETRDIDCTIWLNATLDDGYAEKAVEANVHGPVVDLNMDVYPVDITVNDQAGKPIENATVTIRGVSRKTNSYGYVRFHSTLGELSYFISYKKGKESGFILVNGDIEYEVILQKYSVAVYAVDDRGESVDAEIAVLGETTTMEDGLYESDEIYGSTFEATVRYMGIEKDVELDLSDENEATVSFDVHPPVIESIETSSIGSRPRLTIKVKDEGEYASKVDPASIKVTYQILPSTDSQWADATTFVGGTNTYISDFPEIEPGKLIEFRIEVLDFDGNKVIQTGKFITEKQEEISETPTEEEENGQDFPFFYIAIGAILIIVVMYIVKHILNK